MVKTFASGAEVLLAAKVWTPVGAEVGATLTSLQKVSIVGRMTVLRIKDQTGFKYLGNGKKHPAYKESYIFIFYTNIKILY